MAKFQFFYDYLCPHCKKGYEIMMDALKDFPDIEPEYMPIELNPKSMPNPYLQAFYIAQELGADMNAFHSTLFQKASIENQNVRSNKVLSDILENIIDKNKLLEIIESGKYAGKIPENNDLAYEKDNVWFLPAFRVPGLSPETPRLDAQGGIGITAEDMVAFLQKL